MSTPTMDDAAKVLADPTAYADDARLHAALTRLRAHNPVAWVDNPPYRPFWAITKHADIMAIERDNNLFLSEADFPRMHQLTQEMFGGDDEEYNKRGDSPEEQLAILLDFFTYFSQLTASRREHPTEDLASAIANGRIDGEPLSDIDTASYYVIVASAGHDTTKDAISGGLLALIENPDELE